MPLPPDVLPLIRNRVLIDDGCWKWTGSQRNGYGRLQTWQDGRNVSYTAHRIVWELLVGEIPAGRVLDHLCRNRLCVRPSHLRVCTSAENTHAPGSQAPATKERNRTHCPQGHPYDDANTKWYQGRRYCRACIAIHSRNHRDKLRGGPPRPYRRRN